MITKNTTVRLTDDEQAALNEIAATTGCVLRNGKPSWRILLQEMAKHTFILFDKRKPRKKKEWKKKGKAKIPGAPDWWAPWYGNAMGKDTAIKKSGLSLDELVAMGLTLEENEALRHPEVLVGKPEWECSFVPERRHWWWIPDEDSTMEAVESVGISRMPLDQLTSAGMVLSDCGMWLGVPEKWTGWKWCDKDPVRKVAEEPKKKPEPEFSPPMSEVEMDKLRSMLEH